MLYWLNKCSIYPLWYSSWLLVADTPKPQIRILKIKMICYLIGIDYQMGEIISITDQKYLTCILFFVWNNCYGWRGGRLFYCEGCIKNQIMYMVVQGKISFHLSNMFNVKCSFALHSSEIMWRSDSATNVSLSFNQLITVFFFQTNRTCCCSCGNIKPITSWVPAGIESSRNCRCMHKLGVGWISAVLYPWLLL